MTAEYTGFGSSGYDADDDDGQTTYFDYSRSQTKNVIVKPSINRRKSNIDNDNITPQSETNKNNIDNKQPIDIVKALLKGLTRGYENSNPMYVDNIPKELTDKANMIEEPETFLKDNPEWKMIDNETAEDVLGMRSYINEATKEIEINFHGYDNRPEWEEMVMKTITNPFKNANKAFANSDQYSNSKTEIESLMEKFPEYSFSFNGHSWGAYQARYFASEYKTTSNLLNAHIMPWNKFAKGGTHYYHTTITDPTDFKHIFPTKRASETHFYYPANEIVKDEAVVQKILSGHYISNYTNPGEVGNLSKFARVLNKTGILRSIAIGLTVKDAVDAVKKDVKQDTTTAQKVSDSTIDVGNKAQEFVVGNAIFDSIFAGGVALAPETGGISLAAGLVAVGGVFVYTALSETAAPIVKSAVVKGANEIVKEGNKVNKAIKHFFHHH